MERIESSDPNRYLYTHVHSNIILNSQRWKQPNCPSMDDWVNKVVYPFSGILYNLKRRKIPTRATTWMGLEDIMLSEISQTQKATHCMTPCI